MRAHAEKPPLTLTLGLPRFIGCSPEGRGNYIHKQVPFASDTRCQLGSRPSTLRAMVATVQIAPGNLVVEQSLLWPVLFD
jgi:hypothetical protein